MAAFFIPAAAERPSGTLERNTATTITKPTVPPPIKLTPIATDSGIPSISAPMVIAVPEPPVCWPCERLRCSPPRRLTA